MIEIIDTKWTRGRKRMQYLHLIVKCRDVNIYFMIKNISNIFRISAFFASNFFKIFKWLFKVYRFNKKECKKAIKINNRLNHINMIII